MLDFPRWKVWATWITIVVLCLCAVPSFLPGNLRDQLPGWAKPTVNLGLDLAGGSYILLEAQPEDVRTTRLEAMRDSVEQAMRTGPRIQIGDISTRDGRLTFMVRDASQVDAVRERLLPMTQGAGLTGQRDWNIEVVDSSRFVVTQTEAGLTRRWIRRWSMRPKLSAGVSTNSARANRRSSVRDRTASSCRCRVWPIPNS